MSITAPHTSRPDDPQNPSSVGSLWRMRPRRSPDSSAIGVRFLEDVDRLLDGAARTRQSLLVDRQLGAARVDRLAQADDGQVGELLGDGLQPAADLVELTRHRGPPRSTRTG